MHLRKDRREYFGARQGTARALVWTKHLLSAHLYPHFRAFNPPSHVIRNFLIILIFLGKLRLRDIEVKYSSSRYSYKQKIEEE